MPLRRLLAGQLYQVVTQADEDAARQRLTQYLYGEGTAPPRRTAGDPGVPP